MAKQIYVDENGNPIEVSGTINTAELLPISGNDPTDTKSYIDTGLSGVVGVVDITNNVIKNANYTIENWGFFNCKTFANLVVLSFEGLTRNADSGSGDTLFTLPFSCLPCGSAIFGEDGLVATLFLESATNTVIKITNLKANKWYVGQIVLFKA